MHNFNLLWSHLRAMNGISIEWHLEGVLFAALLSFKRNAAN